jgi:hypothetical protein
MKKFTFTIILFFACSMSSMAQSKSTIVVANPSVTGLFATPEIAAKLVRLELIKMDKYMVYDEFDMIPAYEKNASYAKNCLSKACLEELGKEMNADYIVSGSFDQLGNKIIISLKFIDVKNKTIYKTGVREFDNQEVELQRMTEIILKEMHNIEVPHELTDALKFNNEVITSNNLGKISNAGPRVGVAFMTGVVEEFATRSIDRGGLDIVPIVSMIGYQVEKQYVGTDKFSALVEGIFNVSGLEQQQFIPTITIMNGFRFGKSNYEFAFGPGFGLKKTSMGFFDDEGTFGEKGAYWSDSQFYSEIQSANPLIEHPKFEEHADKRGVTKMSTNFLVAIGRTFKSGALNIPVNLFYSSRKGGAMVGLSVGFNITKSKQSINSNDNEY